MENMAESTSQEKTSEPQPQLECDIQYDHPTIHKQMQKQWNYIDKTIEQNYNTSRVSGGIFLYPRQVSILSDVICLIQKELQKMNKGMTICETGFGSGHSMAMFQSIVWACGNDFTLLPPLHDRNNAPSAHPVNIISFDKFDRPYQEPIWYYLNQTGALRSSQPIQNQYIPGNSCRTIPQHLSPSQGSKPVHCDILHGSSLCKTDNIDLVEHSPCGVLLTSTAMNELTDRSVYFGPQAQWRNLRDRGCITDIVCFQEDDNQLKTLSQDFVFAKRGSNYTGAFCMAMTTGKCQNDDQHQTNLCNTGMHHILSKIRLNHFCPKFQVPVPL
jgi:hypothetical protein